ncbi:hypothetical protein [Streptomyces dysideae]|uniref:Uncharacterized protein n=1 Tax=Streptomyces dysideae TaxID=909626 RepID=A0A117RXJ6_9ACTN|nr:hypothetical protein [Streptomyces dysideae]KUO15227.1 hypothetical protein AQJ91_42490 [Streptomyces dysideae]
MRASATQAALNYLGRRLDELADAFPTNAAAVDVVALTDDINVLVHHLEYATERAQERFAVPETVYLPERVGLARPAEAAAGIAGALNMLTEALTYAATGFHREALPNLAASPLRNDPEVMRSIAADKYAEAAARLRETATLLRPAPVPAAPSTPPSAALRTQPPAHAGSQPWQRAQR